MNVAPEKTAVKSVNKTFDYAAVWREVAKPAFETLSPQIIGLLNRVAAECADLHQLSDTSMPWPETDLKKQFENVPVDDLAFASRVIYFSGHWFPSGESLNLPGRDHGGHWKFSHYADQVLREGLKVSGETPFQIHEGAIRICYSSPDSWTWHEVLPATAGDLANAQGLYSQLARRTGQATRRDRDHAAYEWFEELKARSLDMPDRWKPFFNTDRYMRSGLY